MKFVACFPIGGPCHAQAFLLQTSLRTTHRAWCLFRGYGPLLVFLMLIWQTLQGVYGVWRIGVSLFRNSLPACILVDAVLLIEASTHSGKPHLINVERFLIVAKCFGLEY
jgi:hypothetical protein